MFDTKEALLMLASFSLQVHRYERAAIYASAGLFLFPSDTRLKEILAFAHMHNDELDKAIEILAGTDEDTANLAILRAKLAILTNPDSDDAARHLRSYLQHGGH
ncbi:hypothetical protein [uncultured Tateyamaria sp.]|uniref:hypothetical protein n=1 Tax=uncultured Tateyamaria sp. TaxID=455651 RepID=UPI002611D235|nr:hypothetical protein [uncultured Tateyamaria sp.]